MKDDQGFHLQHLNLILKREDFGRRTLKGLQIAIPYSQLNASVCLDKLRQQGLPIAEIADRLKISPDELLGGIAELPDDGWYVTYLPADIDTLDLPDLGQPPQSAAQDESGL